MAYLVLIVIFLTVSALSMKRAFRSFEDRYMLLFGAALICAAVVLMVWLFNQSPVADMLDYEGRQAPYYQDAVNGTPSAILAYCDNAPRYFGDCLARLELESTATASARGHE